MKHGRKFHFVGIYLFKSILHLKFERSVQDFSGFLFKLFQNFQNFEFSQKKKKYVILNPLVCCSIPSIGLI